jgi:hypothetical protein
MKAGAGFEVASERLEALLDQVHDGRIQVPEFQRAVVLKDEWVKALLASVSLGYPVGAVMLLKADDYYARFATHPVPGAPPAGDGRRPERLLVDGQHRLAALYQALRSGGGVSVRDDEGRVARRSYYIDMRIATNPGADRDEAIFSVGQGVEPERQRSREAAAELGWEDCLFPLRLVFARGAARQGWLTSLVARGSARDETRDDETRAGLVRQFEVEVLSAFDEYVVPVILFPKEWTRWTVRMRGGANGRALSEALGIPGRGET